MERCVSCGEHYDTEEQPNKDDHRCGVCIARSTMFSWKCEKCGASFNGPDLTGDKDKILCDTCKSQKAEQSEIEEIEVISRYTRAEAIGDGVLIDVTETAKEAGIVYPTAVTAGLWADYIEPPEELKGLQDLQGRLWDVLMMFNYAARTSKSSGSGPQTLYFKTIFQMPTKTGHPKMETVELKAICGPGDTAAPVVTIMKTNED
jgi:DNA-directed RNA polymerase subunit RPC12/RpoP